MSDKIFKLAALAVLVFGAMTRVPNFTQAADCVLVNNGDPQTVKWSGGTVHPAAGGSFGDAYGTRAGAGDGINAGWIVVDLGCFHDNNGGAGNVYEREF